MTRSLQTEAASAPMSRSPPLSRRTYVESSNHYSGQDHGYPRAWSSHCMVPGGTTCIGQAKPARISVCQGFEQRQKLQLAHNNTFSHTHMNVSHFDLSGCEMSMYRWGDTLAATVILIRIFT